MSGNFTGSGGAAYMSDRMDWETPADLFAALDDEFGFTLDAAASSSNHKCAKYYTAKDSAFDHEWGGGDGILQSPIWQGDCRMGTQVQYGGQPQGHDRRHAPPIPYRYEMVAPVYPQSRGDQIFTGSATV